VTVSIIKLPEVSNRTSLSRSTIYERIKKGEFPRPISLGERSIGFLSEEIDEWIVSRIELSRKGGTS
jgi:prophage regulatory protein